MFGREHNSHCNAGVALHLLWMRTSIECDSHLMFETRYSFDVEDATLVVEFERECRISKILDTYVTLNVNVAFVACFAFESCLSC